MDVCIAQVFHMAKYVVNPVKKRLAFYFSSASYVRNMRARLLKLNHAAGDMENKKEANDAKNLMVPNHVPSWLEEVETVNKEAEKITTGGRCFNLIIKYKAGKGSVNIVEKIDDLESRGSNIKWTDEPIPLGIVSSSTNTATYEGVHDDDDIQNIFNSRLMIFKDVLKSLQPDCKTQKIALCGMGGVGKTTMMEEVKKVIVKRGVFKWVLRVVVGKKYDPFAIQQAIAEYMSTAPLTETTKDARADELKTRFEKMSNNGTKKILIILDDVWEEIDLKDIGLTSPLPEGFKLLFTSRDEKVCIKMDVESSSIFKMVVLEKAEANVLFRETIRISEVDSTSDLHKIGKDILEKCGGLPLAIKTIASNLRGENKESWKDALVRLCRRDHNLYDIMDGIFDMSYDNLADDAKSIFILCGLFPDDFNIDLEDLMRYGWGLGLFTNIYSLVEARERTNTIVRELIQANLLIESESVGYAKMHDLTRSFVLRKISEFKQASIVNHGDKSEWPPQDTSKSCERILLKCEGVREFPQEFNYPNLALLKLMNGNKLLNFPEDFYKRMKNLKVIGYDKMQYPLLPMSLQCSTSLRTLCLHSCSLVYNDISFLGNLTNLEVLSVAHSSIRKLPFTIGKLERLKLLDLTGCVSLCIDDGVFKNMKQLEELYMQVSKKKSINFTSSSCKELGTLSREFYALEVEFFENNLQPNEMSFRKLQRFRISMGCLLSDYTNGKYSFRNTLKLVTDCKKLRECKINELFSQTGELHLSVKDMSCVEDITKNPSPSSTFCNLKILHFFKCADLTHLFTISLAKGLKKLESLTISSCRVLQSLLSDGVDEVVLPQLLELKLYNLPTFTTIFPDNNTSISQTFLNKQIIIPKLSKLIVDNMLNLKQIWPCDITSGEEDNVSMLREIEVKNCERLLNLFSCNPMGLLSNLEVLKVKACPMEVLFNIDLSRSDQLRSKRTNLKNIEIEALYELKEVWRINDGNESCSDLIIHGFQAVESINIKRCKKLRKIISPTTFNFDIRARRNIVVENSGINDAALIHNGQQQEIGGISNQDIATDNDENMSIVGFPSNHLAHNFQQLHDIHFYGFEQLKVVFHLECPNTDKELITAPQPLLPCLEDLQLKCMDMLSHVWKCNNWNEYFILHKQQPQPSFQSLTTIHLFRCKRIKYLFSPLMSLLLSSLKNVVIVECEGMEEVVLNTDEDEVSIMSTTSTTALFPHLEYIGLSQLMNLKHIGGNVVKGATDIA